MNSIFVMNFLANIGRVVLNFLSETGRLSIFCFSAITSAFRRPFYFKAIFEQMIEIGYYSLPVVGLTAISTGAVLALQSYVGFSKFSAESSLNYPEMNIQSFYIFSINLFFFFPYRNWAS